MRRMNPNTSGSVLDVLRRKGSGRLAEILHVHVNTVTQRLDRVAQLLGTDWQKPDRALEVQLALRLHRLKG